MIKASSPPRKLVERKVPSGLNSAWKLWRHCMCRNGFYPLIIAPFVTSAFFLDIYVSSGCDFVHVNIGIEPVNVAWNKSTLDLGLFSHRSDEESNSNRNLMMETFHPQCKGYGPTFDEYFVDGDKTWKVSCKTSPFLFCTILSSFVQSIHTSCYYAPVDGPNHCISCMLCRWCSNNGHLDDDHHSITVMLLLARSSTSCSACRTSCRKRKIFTL